MSKFFRFLSFRGGKPPGHTKSNLNSIKDLTINSSQHSKLKEGCEDLKESIEHYNQRCMAVQQQKQKDELYRLDEEKTQEPSSLNLKFLSFKSKNKSKTSKSSNQRVTSTGQIIPKDSIECAIVFLDQAEERFFIPKKSLASKLYEQVFYHLDLVETDYFGLQFSDTHNVQHWLDPTKSIKKQCKIGPPYQFFFRVKFYTVEPNNLKEELTRYFYFLQLKNDLRTGRLQCQQDSIAVELCALVLQEELGDFDAQSHSTETISEFRFLPEAQQTEEFESQILEKYRSTSYKAMNPAESELTFLNKAKWLEMYGVDMHCVYGRDGNEYKLGLTPSGILVFEEEAIEGSLHYNNNKIGLFYWPKIEKVMFSKKKFTILVGEDDNRGFKQEHTFIFNLIDEKACKHLWKCAVEYHAFFRLKTSLITNPFGVPQNTNGSGGFNGFIRRGSRFRGPERTEFQTHNMQRLTTPRRSVQFERRPSQRFSRRTAHTNKRQTKLEEMKIMDEAGKDNENLKNSVVVAPPKPLPRATTSANANSQIVPCSSYGSALDTRSDSGSCLSPRLTCCRMQMEGKGGSVGHDQKCNLFKAQQMRLKKEEAAAGSCSLVSEKGSCHSRVNSLLASSQSNMDNLASKEIDNDKLVEKVNIFESLDLSREDNNTSLNVLDKSEASTTDQPLINLNESVQGPPSTTTEKCKETINLDIRSMLERPGTSTRSKDLKMTQI